MYSGALHPYNLNLFSMAGIIVSLLDDNYGEELQAFAIQYYLNSIGYDAEVIDLEKRVKDLSSSKDTIIPLHNYHPLRMLQYLFSLFI